MPELPEVKTVIRKLKKVIVNEMIQSVDVYKEKMIKNTSVDIFKSHLVGETILDIENKGKFIIFKLSNNKNLVSHLRMEGKYRLSKLPEKSKHDHVVFKLTNNYLFYNDSRQFGTFHIFHDEELFNEKPLNKIANEPANIDVKELYEKIKNKSIAIKTTLLDQSLMAGLGNIYVNEVLYRAKINPNRKTKDVSLKELQLLINISDKVLTKATQLGGTSIHSFKSLNDEEGEYQHELKVHLKEGELCEVCFNPILKTKVNGRGTYWCSTCQK